jgi:DNA polymerase (family 10)
MKPAVDKIERFEVCGSYRRKKETIGDLDIILVMKEDDWSNNVEVLSHIYGIAEKVMTKGEQKSSILFGGIQIDFRFVKKEFFVFQLAHATGSADENKRLRSLAKSQGLKLNEYGLFKAGKPLKNLKTEQSVYKALGIPFVKPENR